MMLMTKKAHFRALALLLALLTVAIPLSSCHRRRVSPEPTVPEGFDESRTYEITFWAKNENNESQRNVYEAAVAAFEELYPNIKVTLRNFTDYNDIYKDVITNISTNTTPNVCITYPDHIATYLEGENVVVPLDAFIEDAEYGLGGSALRFDGVRKDEIVSEFLSECVIDGRQYGLPFMRSTEICYVNRTLLESLGYELPETLTWDFVWEVSEHAMSLGKVERDGKRVYAANGQTVFIPFIYKSTDNMMISMLRQLDAPYSDEEGNIGIFGDTTRDLLKDISSHASSGAFSTFKIKGYPANFLNAGQCIFAIDSSAGSTWMGSDAPLIDIAEDKLVSFETAVMTIPQYDAESPKMISQGPSICIFNKEDGGEVLASWLFAQFLLTNEVQIAYSQTEGYVPVTEKAQSSAEFIDYLSRAGEDNDLYYKVKIDSVKLLIDNTENTFTAPVFNGSTSLRSASGELIESVCRDKRADDEYLDSLMRRIMSLYKLDRISEQPLGDLPEESVILLCTLGVFWCGMGIFSLIAYIRKRKIR